MSQAAFVIRCGCGGSVVYVGDTPGPTREGFIDAHKPCQEKGTTSTINVHVDSPVDGRELERQILKAQQRRGRRGGLS